MHDVRNGNGLVGFVLHHRHSLLVVTLVGRAVTLQDKDSMAGNLGYRLLFAEVIHEGDQRVVAPL
jgi:hypothetical protein